MIILFKYCVDVENCENFKGFGFIYTSVGTQAQIYIGSWVLSEGAQWSENRSIARET